MPVQAQTLNILKSTDAERMDAILSFVAVCPHKLISMQLTLPDAPLTFNKLEDYKKDKDVQAILDANGSVFTPIDFTFDGKLSVRISRIPAEQFDKLTITPGPASEPKTFFALVAQVQGFFARISPISVIGSGLGKELERHYESREVALARLEQLTANVIHDTDSTRKTYEKDFLAKCKTLEQEHAAKIAVLDKQIADNTAATVARQQELDHYKKELDDRASKHARRQHYKDIKEKFADWSNKFCLTEGTARLRDVIKYSCLAIMVLSGILVAFLVFRELPTDRTQLAAALITRVFFSALLVSTFIFFIKWNNQWFQKHANEEFRLKRLELDIDRASWFVEMAFEWKDEKGEQIPIELIEKLTAGLFEHERGEDAAQHPVESAMESLLGPTRFKFTTPDGSSMEVDRKGMRRMLSSRIAKNGHDIANG